mmetsp:Transcript_85406/g.134849  ORF Transcript_85406/g.134849 Transcript_85406/m.134849 type:complete len:501 (+) Transcript_85406:84-1586(+)
MASEEGQGMSKSARKRANKKAREAEGAEEESPAPEPKASPKPKATPKQAAAPEKAPEPKAKAKADPKAKPKAAPKEAPKAEPAPAPKPEAKPKPKADAKPKSTSAKPKAKAAAKKEEEEEPAATKEELINYVIDDGSGGGWEMATGLSNKQQKQRNRQNEKKAYEEEMKKQGVAKASAMNAGQVIPGMKPPEVIAAEMKAGKAGPKASQSVANVSVSAHLADDKAKAPEKKESSVEKETRTVQAKEEKLVGRVVGPKGATMKMIMEKTGATIDISGCIVTIHGPKSGIDEAENAVISLIEKGYTALAYDNYEEQGLMVHPSHFHKIIGKEGAIISVIKKEAKVEVSMPETPKDPKAITSTKKYKVTLAGSKEAVEKGKEIINQIVLYGYHPLTHPDFTHAEIEVEEWKYKYLIGTKGSEMKHIQKNFNVTVSIPRPGAECKNVVVIGEQINVDRAVKYIEKVLWNAEQPKGRGQADQADDAWGDEAPEEDWMKAYLYKRR